MKTSFHAYFIRKIAFCQMGNIVTYKKYDTIFDLLFLFVIIFEIILNLENRKKYTVGSKKDKHIIKWVVNKNTRRKSMKNKKIGIIFFTVFVIILIGGYFAICYVKNKEAETVVEEYVPEEEITEEQARQTIISLYFPNKETNELNPEARLIDIKEIMNNAQEKLINLLIEGPKNEKLENVIPEGTKVNKSYFEGDCVVLDFSSEFLNYAKEEEKGKEKLVNSIVNTLTELTEINKVKILIDGNENEEFKEIYNRNN